MGLGPASGKTRVKQRLTAAACLIWAFSAAWAAPLPRDQENDFQRLSAEAGRARDENRVEDACRLYEQLVKLRPEWAEGWWYLGTLRYEQGRYAAAVEAFGKVTALEPEKGPGWGMLGISEFYWGKLSGALNHLTRARAAGLGGNEELARSVRYHQAVLLTRFRRFEDALEILVGFANEHRESPRVLNAMGAAALRIPEPVEELPAEQKEMVGLFGKATFLAAERKLDEAFALYQELETKYRGRPNVAYVFGVAHLLLKTDPDAAVPYFEAELKRDAGHVPSILRLASRMLETSRFDECIAYARRIIELEPANYAGYYLMGRAYLQSKELAQAIAFLENSASLAPELPAIRYSLSQAYQRAGREAEAARARDEFTRLTAAAEQQQGATTPSAPPGDSRGSPAEGLDNLRLQAESARGKGDLPEAVRLYERLVRMRPDWVEGWWYLGSLSYELDQYAAAAAAFEKLLQQDPQNSRAWGLLGLCEYRLQRNAEALEHLTRARRLGLDRFAEFSRVVRLHQAILLNRSRQFEAALFVLNTYATERQEADSILEAMGMAVLRMADPIEDVPAQDREMIRRFGRAAYLEAEQKRDEAFQLYTELEVRYRGRPNVAYALGTALLVRQEPEKAVALFRQELERDPAHDAALLQLALQMIALGKFGEGVEYSRRAIAAAPGNFAGYYALGRNHLYLNDTAQSIAALEKAAEMAPTVAILQYTLSQAYQRAGREADASRARARFEQLEALKKSRRRDLFVSPEDVLPATESPGPPANP